jgi:hypothetical protein
LATSKNFPDAKMHFLSFKLNPFQQIQTYIFINLLLQQIPSSLEIQMDMFLELPNYMFDKKKLS